MVFSCDLRSDSWSLAHSLASMAASFAVRMNITKQGQYVNIKML